MNHDTTDRPGRRGDDEQLPLELPSDAAPRTTLSRLRDDLAGAAERNGLLDIAYRVLDSPVGRLLVATSPRGVVRIAFEREGHDDVLADLAATISPRVLRGGRATDDAARQLDDYFAGTRREFELPVDLTLVSGFRRDVVANLSSIAYGTTASYAQVAEAAGRPKAVRAVGSACSHNPIPVVLPCHRVVRSDGTIGQYLGGTDAKVTLLDLESDPDRQVRRPR